jgi:hypothetical protein
MSARKPVSLQEAILRRARDLAGGVSYLAKHLSVSADELDAMLHGQVAIPSWLVLRTIDFVNEMAVRGLQTAGFPTEEENQQGAKH